MKPGSQKSKVWKHFQKTENGNFVTCQVCEKNFKFFGNTTNLILHLQRRHPTLIPLSSPVPKMTNKRNKIIKQQTKQTKPTLINLIKPCISFDTILPLSSPSTSCQKESISTCNGNVSEEINEAEPALKQQYQLPVRLSNKQKQDIDRCVIEMITQDYLPLSLVENSAFLKYTKKLNPLYQPPSHKQLSSKLLPDLYNECRCKVEIMLNSVQYVSITTDMWSSNSLKSYIAVTCHFIYEYKLFSPVIATKEIYGNHTAENIASVLFSVFEEWNISDKIVIIVSNDDNIQCAVVSYLNKNYHPCVAHILNSIMNDCLTKNQTLNDIFTKCQTLVIHFLHNIAAANELQEVQESMGLPVLNVKQDVSATWNSIVVMIDRLLEIKAPLSAAISNLSEVPVFLDASEWDVISDCIPLLKRVEQMANELSSQKYPTISITVPLTRGLQDVIKKYTPKTVLCSLLRNKLLEVIEWRLGSLETNEIIAKATILDPRFKKAAFGVEENGSNAQKIISEEIMQLVSHKCTTNILQQNIQNSSVHEDDDSPLWSHFDAMVAKGKSLDTPARTANMMLKRYLDQLHLERTKDPLQFWKAYKLTFPELYELHLKYLCIPGTSVPPECLFSTAGQLKIARRNMLSPNYLDKIMSLHSFL